MTHAASRPVPATIDSSAARGTACARIAPTFPLDRFIAVNPYWGLVTDRIELAAQQLGQWSGARLLMPRAWYRDRWQAGQLTTAHLQTALEHSQSTASVEQLVRHLDTDSSAVPRLTLMPHVLDERRDPAWFQAGVELSLRIRRGAGPRLRRQARQGQTGTRRSSCARCGGANRVRAPRAAAAPAQ